MLRTIWLLLLLFVCLPASGAAGLQMQPHTCVVDSEGICQVNLQMQFETETAQAVCFAISGQSQRWCKAAATQHALSVIFSTRVAVTVEVIEQHSGLLLASGTLLLAEFIPSSSRKRRRFSWSFH